MEDTALGCPDIDGRIIKEIGREGVYWTHQGPVMGFSENGSESLWRGGGGVLRTGAHW
jgi:hypothetical protein